MVELDDGKEDDEVSNFSESFFVDDQAVVTDVDFYRQFANAENDIDNILMKHVMKHYKILINLMKFQIYMMDLTMKLRWMTLVILKLI